jgi:multisubunit Na+/H+ antiporter MnhF subunit
MGAPILSDLTPENMKLIGELVAIAPGSLGNSTPAAWLNPNYVTGVDQGNAIVGVTVTFTVIALIAVCLRVYARASPKERALGLDDFTIIPAMVSSLKCLLKINHMQDISLILSGFCHCHGNLQCLGCLPRWCWQAQL